MPPPVLERAPLASALRPRRTLTEHAGESFGGFARLFHHDCGDADSVIKDFTDLIAWQKGMDLAVMVHEASKKFPRDETYGLRAQVRRAATSVPSNVAEGQRRRGTKESVYHLGIALGSLGEVETQVRLAERFRYLDTDACRPLLAQASEVGRLLNGLANSLEAKTSNAPSRP